MDGQWPDDQLTDTHAFWVSCALCVAYRVIPDLGHKEFKHGFTFLCLDSLHGQQG